MIKPKKPIDPELKQMRSNMTANDEEAHAWQGLELECKVCVEEEQSMHENNMKCSE